MLSCTYRILQQYFGQEHAHQRCLFSLPLMTGELLCVKQENERLQSQLAAVSCLPVCVCVCVTVCALAFRAPTDIRYTVA